MAALMVSAAATACASLHAAKQPPVSSSFLTGQKLRQCPGSVSLIRKNAIVQAKAAQGAVEVEVEAAPERFRLGNLSPQPGSRKRNKRKGRGIAAGQGASCGYGMRGQKSRSGSGVRPGFEGGQMPLYRRLPKLKGIAGGMGAGLSKFVTVNLEDIAEVGFGDGEEVTLEALIARRAVNPTGREARLRLKVLGVGDVSSKWTVKAGAFSASAREKLEAAGCTLIDVPGPKKWLPASAIKRQERTAEFFSKKGEQSS